MRIIHTHTHTHKDAVGCMHTCNIHSYTPKTDMDVCRWHERAASNVPTATSSAGIICYGPPATAAYASAVPSVHASSATTFAVATSNTCEYACRSTVEHAPRHVNTEQHATRYTRRSGWNAARTRNEWHGAKYGGNVGHGFRWHMICTVCRCVRVCIKE
jgi:hypothetical protein